jgi:hypothetical protein
VDLNDLETILSHMRLTAGHELANRRVIGFFDLIANLPRLVFKKAERSDNFRGMALKFCAG